MVPTTRRRLKRSSIAPSWSCGTLLAARHFSGHSVSSGLLGTLLNILPGAAAGAAETSSRSLMGAGTGAVQKFQESKYLESGSEMQELDHFTRNRSWNRSRRDLKLGAGV